MRLRVWTMLNSCKRLLHGCPSFVMPQMPRTWRIDMDANSAMLSMRVGLCCITPNRQRLLQQGPFLLQKGRGPSSEPRPFCPKRLIPLPGEALAQYLAH